MALFKIFKKSALTELIADAIYFIKGGSESVAKGYITNSSGFVIPIKNTIGDIVAGTDISVTGNLSTGNTTIALASNFALDRTFLGKGIKTVDRWFISPGTSVFSLTEHPFSWVGAVYGKQRNAMYWTTHGMWRVKNSVYQTIAFSWLIESIQVPVFSMDTSTAGDYYIILRGSLHLVEQGSDAIPPASLDASTDEDIPTEPTPQVEDATQAILMTEMEMLPVAGGTPIRKISYSPISLTFKNNFIISPRGIMSHFDNYWFELATSTYVY